MPRTIGPASTIGPADSASQVSTVRGTTLGRPPPAQGNAHGNGSRGSALGRAPPSAHGNAQDDGYRGSTLSRAPPSAHGNAYGESSRGSARGHKPSRVEVNAYNDGSRGSVGGRPPPSAHGNAYGDGSRGSALGRPARSGESHVGSSASRHYPASQAPSRAQRMDQIQEEGSVVSGTVRPGHQDSRALVRAPQSAVQAAPANNQDYVIQQRFVPMCPHTIPLRFGDKLCSLFKVQSAKVTSWAADGLIRFDKKNWKEGEMPYNIDPLLAQTAPKDIERWDKFVKNWEEDPEYAEMRWCDFSRELLEDLAMR